MSSHERELLQHQARMNMPVAQYNICFNKGTEPAFTGKYWDFNGNGHYSCVGCGTFLFDSQNKFDSGTGWPSFHTAERNNIEDRIDSSHFMTRTELVCKKCGCHLGHVFNDGPEPTGLRYCVNSASIEFKERSDHK